MSLETQEFGVLISLLRKVDYAVSREERNVYVISNSSVKGDIFLRRWPCGRGVPERSFAQASLGLGMNGRGPKTDGLVLIVKHHTKGLHSLTGGIIG